MEHGYEDRIFSGCHLWNYHDLLSVLNVGCPDCLGSGSHGRHVSILTCYPFTLVGRQYLCLTPPNIGSVRLGVKGLPVGVRMPAVTVL